MDQRAKTLEKQARLTHERLFEVILYDPATGTLTWKTTMGGRVEAGGIAGWLNPKGYRQISIDHNTFMAHRLAWFYVKGVWPDEEIDHFDLDKGNNEFSNLREATHRQNCRNRPKPRTNSSGYKGVCRLDGEWGASLGVDKKRIFLGKFSTRREAYEAYVEASKEYHGDFGRIE